MHIKSTLLHYVVAASVMLCCVYMSVLLVLHYAYSIGIALGNVFMGILLGILFMYLTNIASHYMEWWDVPYYTITGAQLFALFAVFAVRQPAWRFIGYSALRGFGFGLLMWGLGYVAVGMNGTERDKLIASVICAVAIFAAPFISIRWFHGASFFVVAVGVRLAGSLTLPQLSYKRQAFIYGLVIGTMLVMLPFLGYYGYGII